MATSHFTPASECPECGKKLDAATGVQADQAPRPGDVSICIYCRTWLRFTDDLTLRIMTKEDLEEMPLDVLEIMKRSTLF